MNYNLIALHQRMAIMVRDKYFNEVLFLCTFLAISALFISCTSPVPSHIAALDESPVTSLSYENLQFEKLPAPGNVAFEVSSALPVLEFNTGKSFVKAFELPEAGKPIAIRLRSYLVGSFDIKRTYIFAPSVILLDKKYRTIRHIDQSKFEYAVPSLTETTGYRAMLEGYIFIEGEKPKEKYLIVYTKHSQLGRDVKLYMPKTVPLWTGVGSVAVPIGKEPVFIPASPTGNLRIILK